MSDTAEVCVGDKVKVIGKDMVGVVKQRIGPELERCIIQMGAPAANGSPIIIEDVAKVEVLVSGAAPKAGAAEETRAQADFYAGKLSDMIGKSKLVQRGRTLQNVEENPPKTDESGDSAT